IGPRNRIIATGHSNHEIVLWDIVRKNILFSSTDHRGEVTAIKFSPDGKFLMSGSNDGTIKIWKLEYT
ncbi:MAG: WD40 repeat domain-containing protein, partial [Merismopedia sp. SIO2A8]|nr:WD40 repeat domain-containing protein [Merismopedia sp. SIO2A8]